jgi:hypothetical protein
MSHQESLFQNSLLRKLRYNQNVHEVKDRSGTMTESRRSHADLLSGKMKDPIINAYACPASNKSKCSGDIFILAIVAFSIRVEDDNVQPYQPGDHHDLLKSNPNLLRPTPVSLVVVGMVHSPRSRDFAETPSWRHTAIAIRDRRRWQPA